MSVVRHLHVRGDAGIGWPYRAADMALLEEPPPRPRPVIGFERRGDLIVINCDGAVEFTPATARAIAGLVIAYADQIEREIAARDQPGPGDR